MTHSYTTFSVQLPSREKMNKRSHSKLDISVSESADRKRYKKGIDRSTKVRHFSDLKY